MNNDKYISLLFILLLLSLLFIIKMIRKYI